MADGSGGGAAGSGGGGDLEDNRPENRQNNPLQASKYVPILGPMLGGSFPASVAIYNMIKESKDVVKFFVFGGVCLGVFAVASGLVAASLGGGTNATTRFASCAALLAVTVALALFTSGLCTLFTLQAYKIACGCVFGLLIALLDGAWILYKW